MTTDATALDSAIDAVLARHATEGLPSPAGCDPADIDALTNAVQQLTDRPVDLPADYRRLLERIDPAQMRLGAELELAGPHQVLEQLEHANPDLPVHLVPVGGEGYFVELELATADHPGGLWVWDPGLDGIHPINGGLTGLLTALATDPSERFAPDDDHIYVDLDIDALLGEPTGWERTTWPDRWLTHSGIDPADLPARHTTTPSIDDALAGTTETTVHARVQVHAGTAEGSIVRLFSPDTTPNDPEAAAIAHLAGLDTPTQEATTARIEELAAIVAEGSWAEKSNDVLMAMANEARALIGLNETPEPTYRLVWWPRTAGPAQPARDSVVEVTLLPEDPDEAIESTGYAIEATVTKARHVRG